MCGWCYGFGPVMDAMQQKFSDDFDFIAVTGGMIVGENIQPISGMAQYIKSSIPNVEATTGIKFGEAYYKLLDEGVYLNNSVKPGIALSVFKSLLPNRSVEFCHDLQYAHFFQGKSLNDKEAYLEIVPNYGIDGEEFLKLLNDEKFHAELDREFKEIASLDISSFPTVLGQSPEGVFLISNGFIPAEEMETIFLSLKENLHSTQKH